jgi:hypothetical protein
MNTTIAYRLVPLRYFPSLPTQEFVNVGVALVCPSTGWWDLRVSTTLRHLRKVFPSAQPDAVKATLTRMEATVREARHSDGRLEDNPQAALESAVGELVGSLRWGDSPIEGVTDNPDEELDHWFEVLVRAARPPRSPRAVATSAAKAATRVEETLLEVFEARGLLDKLQSAIPSPIIKHEFKHTYQNGRLHIFEPISLDRSPQKVVDTAELWRGRIDAVGDDSKQQLMFVPLVQLPKHRKESEEVSVAVRIILNTKSAEVRLFTTDELEQFGDFVSHVVDSEH